MDEGQRELRKLLVKIARKQLREEDWGIMPLDLEEVTDQVWHATLSFSLTGKDLERVKALLEPIPEPEPEPGLLPGFTINYSHAGGMIRLILRGRVFGGTVTKLIRVSCLAQGIDQTVPVELVPGSYDALTDGPTPTIYVPVGAEKFPPGDYQIEYLGDVIPA